MSLNHTDCACFLSQHPCLSLHIIPTLCSSCIVFPAPGSGPDCLRMVTVMCHEQLTPDQVTLLTLIIPQVHFNYSSASSMFLFPLFTCIAPSPDPLPLFLFLQISSCAEELSSCLALNPNLHMHPKMILPVIFFD